MWAREKYRAERTLTELAADTKLRVVLYRPDYIGPTASEAHFGQTLMYWFFAPVGAALKARQIGEAMLEASVRDELGNGDRLSTRRIILYSDTYENHRVAESL
jgi:hypothetical protein